MEYKDPGKYIPIIDLLYSRGSRFGVPSRVPLYQVATGYINHYRGLHGLNLRCKSPVKACDNWVAMHYRNPKKQLVLHLSSILI